MRKRKRMDGGKKIINKGGDGGLRMEEEMGSEGVLGGKKYGNSKINGSNLREKEKISKKDQILEEDGKISEKNEDILEKDGNMPEKDYTTLKNDEMNEKTDPNTFLLLEQKCPLSPKRAEEDGVKNDADEDNEDGFLDEATQNPLNITTQSTTQCTTQINTQSNTQSTTQSTTQINTQSNTQSTTQSTTRINTQSTTQSTTQSSTQSGTQISTQISTENSKQATTPTTFDRHAKGQPLLAKNNTPQKTPSITLPRTFPTTPPKTSSITPRRAFSIIPSLPDLPSLCFDSSLSLFSNSSTPPLYLGDASHHQATSCHSSPHVCNPAATRNSMESSTKPYTNPTTTTNHSSPHNHPPLPTTTSHSPPNDDNQTTPTTIHFTNDADEVAAFVRDHSDHLHLCRHCGVLFSHRLSFFLHMGLHNFNDPHQCNLCGFRCSSFQQFSSHIIHY